MSELLISCLTCFYEQGSYEAMDCTCPHGGKNFFGRNNECLAAPTPDVLSSNWRHPKYPQYKRKYDMHIYKFWKPKTQYENGILLTDKDFEL